MQDECKQVQMSANLKSFTVRVNTEAYREASDKSALLGISMTELVRAAVHQFCTQSEHSGNLNQELNPLLIDNLEQQIKDLKMQVQYFRTDIEEKDNQIKELFRQQDQSQQIIMSMNQNQKLLVESKRTWLQKLFGLNEGSI